MALQDWESVDTGTRMGEGTVIVLGAGASRHLGLPLADELLPEMLAYANATDWETWGGLSAKTEMYEFLTAIYPSFEGDAQKNPGLEYFLSQMDSYQSFFAKGVMGKEDETVERHKKRLLQILVDYIWFRMSNSAAQMENSPYQDLVSHLSYKDTIISLNWDLGCEWALHICRQRGDWSYLVEKSKTPILKVHGSINWRLNRKDATPAHPELFSPVGPDVSYWTDSVKPGASEEKGLSLILDDVPAIVPPSHFKALPDPTFTQVWRHAYQRLLACEKIIIVGYSFREEDRHIYSLFSLAFWNWRDAISSKEKVVRMVGSTDAVERFKRNVYPVCELVGDRFEEIDWRVALREGTGSGLNG